MKKKLVGFMAAIMAVGLLTGCGSNEETGLLKDMNVEKYVTLGEYTGIEVSVAAPAVDNAEWEELVNQVYVQNFPAENGVKDRAIVEGDTANIDYEGKKDGVAFEGGTAAGANLTIGSGQFIEGFEEGLVGVMPGETVDLELTFPEAYHSADLAGQAVVFTVTVNYIIPAELDDTVIAAMGIENVTNEEEYRQYVYDYLYATAESEYEGNVQSAIMEKLMAKCTVSEVPESLMERYKVTATENIEATAAMYGMDANTFTNTFYASDFESFLSSYCTEAAKQDMVLQAIANDADLTVDDAELEQLLTENATAGGYSSVEEFMGESSKEDYREYFQYEKVLDYLSSNAVVTK